MAKIKQGILGGISGTIGNVVGGRWRGIDYIRSKPATYKNPNTEAQQAQRTRFALVSGILKKTSPVIRLGFRNVTGSKTPINRAMSLNLKQAISGTPPNLTLDAEQLIFSEGNLQGTSALSVNTDTAGQAQFSWNSEISDPGASASDTAIPILFNPSKDEVMYQLNGILRSEGEAILTLPESWAEDSVYGYLMFASVTSADVSATQYTGSSTVASGE